MRAWNRVDLLLMFLMWVVKMTAMMVPTAAPMTLALATINQRRPPMPLLQDRRWGQIRSVPA